MGWLKQLDGKSSDLRLIPLPGLLSQRFSAAQDRLHDCD